MAQQRGAQSLVRALEAHGVEYIFGLPGHGDMNILDAIYGSNQISFKLVRHEQAAAHIADGYARISGEVRRLLFICRSRRCQNDYGDRQRISPQVRFWP